MASRPLTAQQEAFCQAFPRTLNQTAAALEAGYSKKSARYMGSRLMDDPRVTTRIQALMDKRAKRCEVSADFVLRELIRIAGSDIGALFDETGTLRPMKDIQKSVRRAVASVEVDELFGGFGKDRMKIGYTKKVKFWDKTRALEMLAKHLGLFLEKEKTPDDAPADVTYKVGWND